MPCCDGKTATTIKCAMDCDKAECICIETKGKSYLCLQQDDKGTITMCTDCTCDSDKKCNKPGCFLIETGNTTCVCVCRDKDGGIKKCLYCKCSPKPKSEEFEACNDCACENGKCCKQGCVCIKTDGKDCVCVCRNDEGGVTVCNDCACDGDRKCGNENCVCIPTKGKTSVCVCVIDGNVCACQSCKC